MTTATGTNTSPPQVTRWPLSSPVLVLCFAYLVLKYVLGACAREWSWLLIGCWF